MDAFLERALEPDRDEREARFGEALVALVVFGSPVQDGARPESGPRPPQRHSGPVAVPARPAPAPV